MNCWVAGAKGARGSEYDFTAYPYPPCKTLDHGCQEEKFGKDLVTRIATDMAQANRPIVIVGHSSGSDLANSLATKLYEDGKNVSRLIDLDGYGIPSTVPSSITSECVTAEGTDGAHSAYWDWAHHQCGGRPPVVEHYSGCETAQFKKWCLHFHLTNSEASPEITPKNYGDIGYQAATPGCKPELGWLPAAARLKSNTATGSSR